MPRWYWLLLIIALVGAWHSFSTRPLEQPPGELAPADPSQQRLAEPYEFEARGHALTARARISMTARVLASERYRADTMASLVPYDLALGWGLMSDSAVLERVAVSQGNRFYYWRTEDDTLPLRELARHSANVHLIAANSEVAQGISSARVGQVVSIDGLLVDVHQPGRGGMSTSLSRDDTGPGACEIVWAESFVVRQKIEQSR